MQPRTPAAFLGLAILAAAACGKTREEERVDKVRDACNGIVPGTTLYRNAVIALEFGELRRTVCNAAGTLSPAGADDRCDYGTTVCQDDLIFVANDSRACSTGPGGGCIYGCVLRIGQAELQASPDTVEVCARFFYDPQPCSAVAPVVCQ